MDGYGGVARVRARAEIEISEEANHIKDGSRRSNDFYYTTYSEKKFFLPQTPQPRRRPYVMCMVLDASGNVEREKAIFRKLGHGPILLIRTMPERVRYLYDERGESVVRGICTHVEGREAAHKKKE